MTYSRRSRYSHSPSPKRKRYGRSVSRSSSRSQSFDASDIENPGNSLYVMGLSHRITKRDLEKHFSVEGKVEDVHLVIDPRTRESRGFAFVSMSNVKEADRCIKYLDASVLEGRVITVEKARRRRGRTPTPGKYLGLRTVLVHHRSPSYSLYSRRSCSRYSSERDRSRSRSYSPYDTTRGRSYSRSSSPYSRSPAGRRRSYTPDHHGYRRTRPRSRSYTPEEDGYYRRDRYRYRSRSYSPDDSYYSRNRYRSRDYSPHYRPSYTSYRSRSRRYRSVSRSVSSSPRRHYRRSQSSTVSLVRRSRRSYSPRSSPSVSPTRSRSPTSSSVSGSVRSCRSVSRSPTPRSASP